MVYLYFKNNQASKYHICAFTLAIVLYSHFGFLALCDSDSISESPINRVTGQILSRTIFRGGFICCWRVMDLLRLCGRFIDYLRTPMPLISLCTLHLSSLIITHAYGACNHPVPAKVHYPQTKYSGSITSVITDNSHIHTWSMTYIRDKLSVLTHLNVVYIVVCMSTE